ncbi:Oxoglutarate iron-dependent dioxygenase protein [Rutstroemia sp. NJR-2017a BBW]|nr:Oxoglutarate iron-dependent dioxygenase protein [Rutstroemia sp. NJR-2017a BBW]
MATQIQTVTSISTSTDPVENLSFRRLPPFPDDMPTAPLHRLSLSALRKTVVESEALFAASKNLGFFYLDLRDDDLGNALIQGSDQVFGIGPDIFDLGREKLAKYDHAAKGSIMGYKGYGSQVVDEKGNLDRNEFFNIPKDDILGISQEPLPQPDIIHQRADLLKSFMTNAHKLVTLIFTHLEKHLQLPPQALTSLHRLTSPSGDHIRLIRAPAQPPSDLRTSLGKHTDFGSITILFNRLGGLQILPPPAILPPGQSPEWMYVKPIRDHCIINFGDAMTKFTRGVVRSNIHRVVAPPGQQGTETRWSVVYFGRPEDDVVLRGLVGEKKYGEEEEGMNAKEWIKLQGLRLRNANVAGKEMGLEERRKLWEESGRGYLVCNNVRCAPFTIRTSSASIRSYFVEM